MTKGTIDVKLDVKNISKEQMRSSKRRERWMKLLKKFGYEYVYKGKNKYQWDIEIAKKGDIVIPISIGYDSLPGASANFHKNGPFDNVLATYYK